jgi:predicted enzyme related to lactoylglutathione lyase
MAEVNAPNPEHFVWIELATTDPVAAKGFYTKLFGWKVNENDMGEMGIYYIFRKQDRDAAAMYRLMPDQAKQGVPPNWASYVGVTSADETATKAQGLGGTVLAPPFDVFDHGRMAVVKDPAGAVFALWQAKQHWGVTIRDEANTLCWNELATHDAKAARDFYSKLFGWTFKISDEYSEIHIGDRGIGGIRTMQKGEQMPPNWMPYFMADDCDAMTKGVESGGGRAYVPPTDLPNVGRFSVVADPQGAVFALFKPAPRA